MGEPKNPDTDQTIPPDAPPGILPNEPPPPPPSILPNTPPPPPPPPPGAVSDLEVPPTEKRSGRAPAPSHPSLERPDRHDAIVTKDVTTTLRAGPAAPVLPKGGKLRAGHAAPWAAASTAIVTGQGRY